MENQNKKVYCRGTKDGKGVIEALEERGGVNTDPLFGNSTNFIYYIDPVTNSIIATERDTPIYNMVTSNYTEIQPLKPKRWRAKFRQLYYTIQIHNGACKVVHFYEEWDSVDNKRYEKGNYYRTKEECQKVADACNKIIESSANDYGKE